MISKRIVYTRHNGGVTVYCPTREVLHLMVHGGVWSDRPRGFLETQIERMISDGIDQDHARKFAHAVQFGGVTESEAWGIIRDRDCARHGTLHEMQDFSDLPDRWFRNAWRRSRNGGPVVIDLEKARPLQWQRVKTAVHRENKRRDLDFYSTGKLRVPWVTLRSAIRHASDTDELRRIWPEGLNAQH